MQRYLVTLSLLLSAVLSMAQGILRGRVSDDKGEVLIGATVYVKTDLATGTTTDLDGKYSLQIATEAPVTIVVSFMSYEQQEHVVQLKDGEVKLLDVEMRVANVELKEFVVEGRARRSSDTYLDKLKINSATSIDFISRDAMLRTGDGDAAAAVKRVSGVSTVNSFVTVRGLADRYIVTTVNGSRIPTLDPFTNNLRLDLFPTGLMDNIIITKTATPELPGDWAGAYLSMNTSDYPQRLSVSVSTSIGYNPNSTGQEIVTGGTSGTDWLGRDDGTRAIPGGVPEDVEDFPTFVQPDLYQQLQLLGLQPYLNSLGITSSTPGFSTFGMTNVNTLHHVALVQMGLLPAGLLYNQNAVEAGVSTYNNTYDLAYFSPIVNSELATLNTRFDNSSWRVGRGSGDPNYNVSFGLGNQIDLFKKKEKPKQLGYRLGFRYSADTQFDPEATIARTQERPDDEDPGEQFKRKGTQSISQISNGWNALGSMGFKLDRNNSFTLLGMANVLGQNNARYVEFLDPTISGETFVSEEQFWEQRRLWVAQYGSKHFIPAFNLTVTADASHSTGDRDILDMKTVQYVLPPPGQPIEDVDGALIPPGRIYRYLDERMSEGRLGFEKALGDDPEKPRELKLGGSYRNWRRLNEQKYFVVLGAPGPTQWEDASLFMMQEDGTFRSRYAPFGSFKDNDIGILNIAAGYLMTDYSIDHRVRIAGGVRVEHSDMISDIYKFWEEGIAADDTVRGTVGDLSINGASAPEPKPAVPGVLDQWDVLPSVSVIYKLRTVENAPMNLRLGYFRSLGRPSFREFSVVQYYDYLLQAPVFGNPELEMTRIENFDLRTEYFLQNGDNISISAFYKQFTDHIELLQTAAGGFTWRNADHSEVYGAELEGRFKLMRQLEWRGNLTVMHSRSMLRTVIQDKEIEYSTPMFGQAPYIVNSMLTYSLDSLRASFSLSYNVQGPRLAVSNSELDPDGIRAYDMPRHLIDITANKRFGKHWGVMFRIRDLLNAPMRRSYLFDSGFDHLDFDSYAYGTEFQLTLSYTIQ